jgi:hypothetical protein
MRSETGKHPTAGDCTPTQVKRTLEALKDAPGAIKEAGGATPGSSA